MKEQPKLCPFCGSKVEVDRTKFDFEEDGFRVICPKCEIRTAYYRDRMQAIWNLLNCPFCGKNRAFVNTIEHSPESRPNGYRFHGQVTCLDCGATAGTTGFDATKEEADRKAINAWNRRIDSWISVTDRLPTEDDADESGYVLGCHAYDSKWAHKFTCQWDVVPNNVRLGNMTHWQRCPSMPEGVDQG